MGWLRGDLSALRGLLADGSPSSTSEAPVPVTDPATNGPALDDAALLENLEMLLELELLEDWDPEADLPIPVASEPPMESPR